MNSSSFSKCQVIFFAFCEGQLLYWKLQMGEYPRVNCWTITVLCPSVHPSRNYYWQNTCLAHKTKEQKKQYRFIANLHTTQTYIGKQEQNRFHWRRHHNISKPLSPLNCLVKRSQNVEKRPISRDLLTTCIKDTEVVLAHVRKWNFENKTVKALRSLTYSFVNRTM